MDKELNVTYITLSGYAEVKKHRYVYFLIFLVMYLVTICCNSTIVCLIMTQQRLHEPMYVFIAALLLNCAAYSCVVYPRMLVDTLSEEQLVSHSVCHVQFFFFYSVGGSEFLLLLVMAYDRYVSICRPLQYAAVMTRRSISMVLVLAWIIPVCLVACLTAMSVSSRLCSSSLNSLFCNNLVYRLHCQTSAALSVYGICLMLIGIFIPILLIIFTYVKILLISYRSSKDVRTKAAQTCLPHLLVLVNYSALASYNVIVARLNSQITGTAQPFMTLQLVVIHPLINPIIYGVKMKEISKHINKLFSRALTQ